MAQAALVAVAIAALAAVALMAAVVPRGASAESLLEQAKVDAALNQLLAARRAGGAGLHQDGRQLAKARMAMRTLERNLQGELTTVQAVLGSYDVKGSTTLASSDSDSNSDRAAWEKRTIQRGAMRGESTQKQLTRVLEKDLSDKVAKKLKPWSRADLANAADRKSVV